MSGFWFLVGLLGAAPEIAAVGFFTPSGSQTARSGWLSFNPGLRRLRCSFLRLCVRHVLASRSIATYNDVVALERRIYWRVPTSTLPSSSAGTSSPTRSGRCARRMAFGKAAFQREVTRPRRLLCRGAHAHQAENVRGDHGGRPPAFCARRRRAPPDPQVRLNVPDLQAEIERLRASSPTGESRTTTVQPAQHPIGPRVAA